MDFDPCAMLTMAEKFLCIRGKDGRVRPLHANAAQRRFEQRRGRHNIVLKARQMGMTTWVAGRFLMRTALLPGTTTLLVAHTREAAEGIFGMVRRMWELLPEELREDALALRRSNAGEIAFAIGSEFRVASASDANAGRGLSVQNLHCSEVSRWPGDGKATLAGLRAALAPGGELVLESTPSGAYGAFYEAWCDASDGVAWGDGDGSSPGWAPDEEGCREGTEMVRHFFPWWLEPSYAGPEIALEEMSAEEQGLVHRHGLSLAQIGYRRGLARTYGSLRNQEFAEDGETCFRATGSCCFEVDALEQRLRELVEPIKKARNGALLEWLSPMPGRAYVVAVDTTGGMEGGDFGAVQVVDLATGMQCAELQERLRPAELADVCFTLAKTYGNALIAVERNNHGAAVLALLITRPGVRIYEQGGQAGWLTSAASKPEAVARLGTLLLQTPALFSSKRLLGECRTFVSDERGRTGAANGAHDDLVMAMAIAHAVRAEVLQNGDDARGKRTEENALFLGNFSLRKASADF